jgi:hypothetical protein
MTHDPEAFRFEPDAAEAPTPRTSGHRELAAAPKA